MSMRLFLFVESIENGQFHNIWSTMIFYNSKWSILNKVTILTRKERLPERQCYLALEPAS